MRGESESHAFCCEVLQVENDVEASDEPPSEAPAFERVKIAPSKRLRILVLHSFRQNGYGIDTICVFVCVCCVVCVCLHNACIRTLYVSISAHMCTYVCVVELLFLALCGHVVGVFFFLGGISVFRKRTAKFWTQFADFVDVVFAQAPVRLTDIRLLFR